MRDYLPEDVPNSKSQKIHEYVGRAGADAAFIAKNTCSHMKEETANSN